MVGQKGKGGHGNWKGYISVKFLSKGLEAAPPGLPQPKKSLDKWTKVVGSALDMFEISMYLHTNYKKSTVNISGIMKP